MYSLPIEVQEAVEVLRNFGVRQERLLALVLRKKPGRPPKVKRISSPRRRGRPRTWTAEDYRIILAARARGQKLLQERGINRITDVMAMEEVCAREIKRSTMAEHKARAWGRALAKRLPDARKSVLKSAAK